MVDDPAGQELPLTLALEESPRARSSTSTAASSAPVRIGRRPDPARSQRRDRRLQGGRVRAPCDRAGHSRPGADDRVGEKRSSARATFEGILGAPVLTSEFERDPMRGAFPGDAPPEHDPIGHLAVVGQRRRLPGRPGLGQHPRQARVRPCRLDRHHLLPRLRRRRALVAPAMNNRMYSDAATQANLATLRERGHRRDRTRRGRARLEGRARRRAPARARATAAPGRSRAAGGAPSGPGTGCGSWSPPAAPASRSTRFATSATAPAVAWDSPWPSGRRAAAPRSP